MGSSGLIGSLGSTMSLPSADGIGDEFSTPNKMLTAMWAIAWSLNMKCVFNISLAANGLTAITWSASLHPNVNPVSTGRPLTRSVSVLNK